MRRLQEAQDNLLRLFDEVRNYAAPIQLENDAMPFRLGLARSLEPAGERRGEIAMPRFTRTRTVSIYGIAVDRFRIAQVFRNLLENSLAACGDPVVIQIECRNAHLHGRPASR